MSNNFFFLICNGDKLIYDSIHRFFDFNVDIFNNFDLYDSLLDNRNLNLSLYLTNYDFLNFF